MPQYGHSDRRIIYNMKNIIIGQFYSDDFFVFPFLKGFYDLLDIKPFHIPITISNTKDIVSKVNSINDKFAIAHTPLIELNKGINYCDDDAVAKKVLNYGICKNIDEYTQIFINCDLIDTEEEFRDVLIHEISHSVANRYWAMTRADKENYIRTVSKTIDEEKQFYEKFEGEKDLLISSLSSGFAIREIGACYFSMKYEYKKYGESKLLKTIEKEADWPAICSGKLIVERYNVGICNCIAAEILLKKNITDDTSCKYKALDVLEKIICSPQSYREIMTVSSILTNSSKAFE